MNKKNRNVDKLLTYKIWGHAAIGKWLFTTSRRKAARRWLFDQNSVKVRLAAAVHLEQQDYPIRIRFLKPQFSQKVKHDVISFLLLAWYFVRFLRQTDTKVLSLMTLLLWVWLAVNSDLINYLSARGGFISSCAGVKNGKLESSFWLVKPPPWRPDLSQLASLISDNSVNYA